MHGMLLQIQLCFGIYYIGLLACRCTGMPPLYENGESLVTLLSGCGFYWMDCILFFISGITVTKT